MDINRFTLLILLSGIIRHFSHSLGYSSDPVVRNNKTYSVIAWVTHLILLSGLTKHIQFIARITLLILLSEIIRHIQFKS